MPQVRILAQSEPAGATPTVLYTVPQGKYMLVKLLNVSNTTATTKKFRFSISKAGAATSNKDYVHYDINVLKETTFRDSDLEDLRLEETDVIRIYTSAIGLSFNLYGTEVGV